MTILADTSTWGSIFEDILLVIHIVVCLLLCLVVLMQRPKQEGLGAAFGGGMTDQAFGARTTDVLQKGTVYLASILFIIALVLSILVSSKSNAASIDKDNEENVAAAVDENPGLVEDLLNEAEAEIDPEALVDALKNATGEADNKEAEAGEDKPETEPTPEAAETPEATEPAPAEETETPEQ